jgi:uncharacterized membrane protein HdeD (DUF308 family)
MSTANPRTTPECRNEQERLLEIPAGWPVFAGLGALTMLVGLGLIFSTFFLTRATALASGWLMVVGGAVQIAGSVVARRWIGSVAAAINGLIHAGIGIVLFSEHAGDATGLMLVVAGLVFALGVSRLGLGLIKSYTHREVSVFHGALSLMIAGMILAAWYGGLVWGVGFLLGIEVIFTGVTWLAFSQVLRRMRETGPESAAF